MRGFYSWRSTAKMLPCHQSLFTKLWVRLSFSETYVLNV